MNNITFKSFFILLYIFCAPIFVLGAEIRLETNKDHLSSGDEVLVDIFFSSSESVNAVEGKLVFPQDLLQMVNIYDGNSTINFWLTSPQINELGVVIFSGITPGGFSGTKNKIFSVAFKAKDEGKALLFLKDTQAFYNDGLGTMVNDVESRNVEILIQQGGSMPSKYLFKDIEPPEDFNVVISSNQTIFNGKYFLVFSTQDKGLGIDRYEVREGSMGWFKVAESPYLLKHQQLDKKIYIKAIDKNGNERVVTVGQSTDSINFGKYILLGILLIVIVVLGYNTIYSKCIK